MGRDGDAVRVPLADNLARRLRTLILTRLCRNVAIEAMSIEHPCRHHDSGRGRGGKDDAASSGSGPTTLFVLKRTNCHVESLSSGAGRMPTLEVILRASSVVLFSSKSATLVTVLIDDGAQSVTASAAREELARAEQRIWGDDPDKPSYGDPDEDRAHLGIPPSRKSRATWRRTGLPPMVLVPLSCRQWTMV